MHIVTNTSLSFRPKRSEACDLAVLEESLSTEPCCEDPSTRPLASVGMTIVVPGKIHQMRIIMYFLLTSFLIYSATFSYYFSVGNPTSMQDGFQYWLLLHRKSNFEFLYFGIPNDKYNSQLIKIFKVKTGIPGERPTPLPKLLGRGYWLITTKEESKENPETSPYFLFLNIPVTEQEPYGPKPYLECNGQCNWVLPGSFGLHGVNGEESRLSKENPGSSGCVRHFDGDITYLYYILDSQKTKVRYYVEDI